MGKLKYELEWVCIKCGYGKSWKSDCDRWETQKPNYCPKCGSRNIRERVRQLDRGEIKED